ncbi:MAG: GDP-mannose 4,6-dehydratase [Acidobacteriota bacterium]
MTENATRALITGGAGFIGSHLAELLLERGHRVTIIDDLSTGRLKNIEHLSAIPAFSFAIDSITDEIVMDRLVSECDVIFHLAAAVGVELIVRDPVHVIETNILGTHAVLKVANRYRKKVLLASTSEIYGKSNNVPFEEEDDRLLGPVTRARWSYSSSKAVDEFLGLAYFRQMDLPVVIFRLFNTVGPRQTGQYGMVIPRFVLQALKGESLTVYGDGQQQRCFCNVGDAIEAITGLAESPEAVGKVFNIGSTEEISILQLAEKVLAMVGEGSTAPGNGADEHERIRLVPYEQAYGAGFEDMRRRVPDTSKIRETIGWEPRFSLDETLGQVIAHYRSPDG